jgi:hypothetical protein
MISFCKQLAIGALIGYSVVEAQTPTPKDKANYSEFKSAIDY